MILFANQSDTPPIYSVVSLSLLGTPTSTICDPIQHIKLNSISTMATLVKEKQTGNVDLVCEEDVEGDYFDGVYDYIQQMLLEEDDLDHRPCMSQDFSALQAAENSFHDALVTDKHDDHSYQPHAVFTPDSFGVGQRLSSASPNCLPADSPQIDFNFLLPNRQAVESTNGDTVSVQHSSSSVDKRIRDYSGENGDTTRTKQFASGADDDPEPMDDSLLCPNMNPNFYCFTPDGEHLVSDNEDQVKKQYRKSTVVKRGRPKGSKKNRTITEVVDLMSLLTRCAQAVAGFDTRNAEELLKQIRQSSSPYGDANERLAHCFANALEARMAGTGGALYSAVASRKATAAELLKSYNNYVRACPFKRMSNICANKTIGRQFWDVDKIHIIDFGIMYGFQWPCIIHGISMKPGGPPLLRITGIDFPQSGFKPAERVERTGDRLRSYCKRFNVPLEYNAVAKKWEDISLEELNIKGDETVVVNCLYRLRHVLDESAGSNNPRDAVLKLIKSINPDLFVHGVVNGTYDAPFFTTRFREALYNYSSWFDMMAATLPKEDEDRLLYEREVFGRDVMNVIACEGSERVERPDTYKQWQVRIKRHGFKQLPLNRDILNEVKVKVRRSYHNDFMIDEDSDWMLQGWKGRVMHALSFWKPTRD